MKGLILNEVRHRNCIKEIIFLFKIYPNKYLNKNCHVVRILSCSLRFLSNVNIRLLKFTENYPKPFLCFNEKINLLNKFKKCLNSFIMDNDILIIITIIRYNYDTEMQSILFSPLE